MHSRSEKLYVKYNDVNSEKLNRMHAINLRPLEPDAEEFKVHDAEVADGECKQVDGRADGAHLSVRQHDKVEAVGHRACNDDR